MKIFKILLIIFIGLALIGWFFLSQVSQEAAQINITTPDWSQLADGEYIGEAEMTPVKVKTKVQLRDHKITAIDILEHQNGLGGKAESIIDEVLATQSLDVETVSGATVSSKIILKSIENSVK